jgi:hypothetical protein
MPALAIPTNTTQLLAEMTDRGRFELLVRRVLHLEEPAYRVIVLTGTNESGETVAAPVDGIGGRDGNYALLEATTTDKKKLRTKWLSSKPAKDEGDLLKAARLAAKIRKHDPAATVTVVLATNEGVDETLYADVKNRAAELGVTADIWERSRIATVLDSTPAGQALRREYLDIQATLLSRELMAQLCAESARAHAATLLTESSAAPRAIVSEIAQRLSRSGVSLTLLRGSSGYGKSTAAHHVMRRLMDDERIALWLPAGRAESLSSISATLTDLLTELNGQTPVEAAESLLALVGETHPLILVVDDLRELASPGGALRKLISWSKPQDGLPQRIAFIVPVWPQMLDDVAAELREALWIDTIEIDAYTREESTERILVAPMSAVDADTFAAILGDDPFLIGRWSDLVRRGTAPSPELARNTLSTFVRDALQQTTNALPLLDVDEIEQALIRLSRAMIEHRDIRPQVSTVRGWLAERDAQIIDAVAKQTRILSRTDAAGRHTIVFRHDRLQDHFFCRAFAEIFDGEDPAHVVADPYFARVIGMALAGGALDHLSCISAEAPLALFEALRFARDAREHAAICDSAAQWLAQNVPHPELERAILSALSDAEDGVQELLSKLPNRREQQIVRLRHGDARGAIDLLRAYGRFLPSATFRSFENAVEHARIHRRAEMAAATKEVLADPSRAETQEGLELAGYLALPELSRSILSSWEQSGKDDGITIAALWAAARCADDDAAEIVGPIFDHYARLSEKRHDEDSLRLAFKLPPTRAASTAIARRAKATGKTARMLALWILQRVDHPDVFRLHVADAAEAGSIADSVFATEARTSAESRRVLLTIWQDTSATTNQRKAAFRVWAATATPADIPALPPFADDSVLGATITRLRSRLGDAAASAALAKIGNDTTNLFWAHRVWSPDLCAVVDRHLQELVASAANSHSNDAHHISRIVRHIPSAHAETLLERHWPGLRASPLFIQSAIVIGTPRTLALAREAIAALPPDVYPFRHMWSHFGLWHQPGSEYREALPETVLTMGHLESLTEFAAALRADEIHGVFGAAIRRGWFTWLKTNFAVWTAHLSADERETERKYYLPTDADLRAEFLEVTSEDRSAHYWVEDAPGRGIETDRIVHAAVAAARSNNDAEIWNEVITVLAHVGRRVDLVHIEPQLPDNNSVRSFFSDIAFAIRRRNLE